MSLPDISGGHHAEFGCGPFTQTLGSLLAARPELSFKSITLLDPNLANYFKEIPTCTYRTGRLVEDTPTNLVSAGAEVRLFTETFDSLLIINVLEHTQDSYAVLHNVWASLKPGGILIFQDMHFNRRPEKEGDRGYNGAVLTLHPIHIKLAVLELFFSHFEKIFRNDYGTDECHQRGEGYNCIFFIGRKLAPGQEPL